MQRQDHANSELEKPPKYLDRRIKQRQRRPNQRNRLRRQPPGASPRQQMDQAMTLYKSGDTRIA